MINYIVPDCWYEGVYKDKACIVNAARSFTIENNNSRAVLLIHGYAGYPGELIRPAKDLSEHGFDVFCPRLPGMGTSGKDFLCVTKDDWLKTVDNVISYLKSRYSNISIVAHSMGTLLALIAASKFDIEKVVLAAPAFNMPQLKRSQVRLLSLFKKDVSIFWQPDSRYKMYYDNAPCDDINLGKEYWSHIYPKRLLDLDDLKIKALKLNNIKSKILILKCLKDTVTDSKACNEYLNNHNEMDVSVIEIENATHFIYYDIDKEAEERGVNATLDFLK